MVSLVAQIAPQKSTQYAQLASALAPHELRLCPVGSLISEMAPIELGGQQYLRLELTREPTADELCELGGLAATSAYFAFHPKIGRLEGPFLRPLETGFSPALPPRLVTTRRYRGKTNELFTQFMCNIARFSSALSHRPWDSVWVLDPLAGGGTTLFVALMLGASAAGIERNATVAQSTATFLNRFMREQGIACSVKRERFRKVGQRWVFTIGKDAQRQQCIVARGNTLDATSLVSGFRPHLIVTDLPYGIQHRDEFVSLLTQALPVWAALLAPSGTLVFAWDARRLSRAKMVSLVESSAALRVLDEPPYDALAHRVERVIKRRDVIVARPANAQTQGRPIARC